MNLLNYLFNWRVCWVATVLCNMSSYRSMLKYANMLKKSDKIVVVPESIVTVT